MSKAYKGSDFERLICVKLSEWWSEGIGLEKRSDIFWRSSQSGGRATQRTKKGQRTYGSYGDIAAIDPIGEPLLKAFTIELKRGSSYSHPGDLLDFKLSNHRHPWAICLLQAIRSHQECGSAAWMMICRRDHRQAIVYLERRIFRMLREGKPTPSLAPMGVFYLTIRDGGDDTLETVSFMGLTLDTFLHFITPRQIIQYVKRV